MRGGGKGTHQRGLCRQGFPYRRRGGRPEPRPDTPGSAPLAQARSPEGACHLAVLRSTVYPRATPPPRRPNRSMLQHKNNPHHLADVVLQQQRRLRSQLKYL